MVGHRSLITQRAKWAIAAPRAHRKAYFFARSMTYSLLDTQIALVEAEEGIAIIPSFGT
jgi:hypothetical protein